MDSASPDSGLALPTGDLKLWAQELGFQGCGVCDAQTPPHYQAYADWVGKGYGAEMAYLENHLPAKRHPERLLLGCKSVLAFALNYNQAPPEGPKIARYALGRDYHKVLRRKLGEISRRLCAAHPGLETRVCVDSAPLMERDFAQLAGLGWFGKNTCLIDSKRGSWFVLGFILANRRFQPDAPAIGGCGSCRACIDACPTGAIVNEEDRWQVRADRCISYLTIEKKGEVGLDLSGWVFGCDVCQEVCPFNHPRPSQPLRALETSEADFLAVRRWPQLEQLAQIGHAEWDRLTQGSPVRRAGLEGLRRNARLNLP